MVTLDGVAYNIKNAQENAFDMVETINQYCISNDIRNSKGEVVFIEVNWGSPLFLMIYACGYQLSILQRLIYQVGLGLSIYTSSDLQLLDLAECRGLRRRAASKTTIRCVISADNVGDCQIEPTMSVTIPYGASSLKFFPNELVVIPMDSAKVITLVCSQSGAYAISSGAVTAFDAPVANLSTIQSDSSTPGKSAETVPELRLRFQALANVTSRIEAIEAALADLEGVVSCSCVFNPSGTVYLTVGPHQIPPRQMLILLEGFSTEIAKTYYSKTMAESYAAAGSQQQIYTTRSGQVFPVYFLAPIEVQMFVSMTCLGPFTAEKLEQIRETLMMWVQTQTKLQIVTAAGLTKVLLDAMPTLTILGFSLSDQFGAVSATVLTCDSLSVLRLSKTNIAITEDVP